MSQVTSLPRPLLFALIGVLAVGAVLLATRGRGGDEESLPAAPTPAQTAPSPTGSGTPAASGTPAQPTQAPAAAPKPASKPKQGVLPSRVSRALDAKKVVVLLFWNPKGSDDPAVKSAVDSVPTRGGKVAKFTDTLPNLSRYTRISGAGGVTQTPTVVVVDRQGNGKLTSGYVDPISVDQLVVNALG